MTLFCLYQHVEIISVRDTCSTIFIHMYMYHCLVHTLQLTKLYQHVNQYNSDCFFLFLWWTNAFKIYENCKPNYNIQSCWIIFNGIHILNGQCTQATKSLFHFTTYKILICTVVSFSQYVNLQELTLTTICACPGMCSNSHGSISAGSIILIT